MRGITYSVVVLALAGYLGAADAAGQTAGPNPQQQSAPQEQATAEQPAATQPTIARSGPEPAPAVAPFDAEQAKRHQEAWAKHLGVPVEFTNSIGMKLVLIPPGEFMMGNGESADEMARAFEEAQADEYPQHRVRITKTFYLGQCEVTQGQYERVMETNPSYVKGPQHPVESVSWSEAFKFCNKLSALPEEKAAGRTYRLPTEAESEYVCRAGSTTRYSFGNDAAGLEDHGWFKENSSVTTHPAGQKQPSAWGLYDVDGNVEEWCSDWYGEDYYKSSPVDDPTGPTTGPLRVYRGGGWYNPAVFCWVANRGRSMPNGRDSNVGFRVAAVLSGQQGSK